MCTKILQTLTFLSTKYLQKNVCAFVQICRAIEKEQQAEHQRQAMVEVALRKAAVNDHLPT